MSNAERMNAVNDSERTAPAIAPPQKWVNAGPDEGALHALLDRIVEHVPREQIDVLWIFPTRVAGGVESTVIVIARFDEDAERRTVATAHFRVTRDRRGRATVALQMQEHGSAPIGATQRVVDGVLRRLGDEVGREAPRRVEIGGTASAWWELYADVGGEVPEGALAGADDADENGAQGAERGTDDADEKGAHGEEPQTDDADEKGAHGEEPQMGDAAENGAQGEDPETGEPAPVP
jgi:hypothetical protein